MGAMERLSALQVVEQVPAGWALLVDGLHTRVATGDFATGVALVAGIGAAAERLGRAPDLALRAVSVDVRLTTTQVHGVTAPDIDLAAAVSTLVDQAGLTTSTRGVSRLELGLDTPDLDAVADFWAAVFGADRGSGPDFGDEVRDRTDALPTVWFQASGSEEPRQRWHPDVWVDPSEVQDRIDAALRAGGRLVSDAEAPAFWVLADHQDNRVCLCTWQGRG